MLGLSVATAKQFLKTAVAETVNGGGYNWNDEMVSRHIEESIQERFWYPSVIFAADNGRPVGCILFGLQGNVAPWIRDDEHYKKIFIDTLYVSPEYRRMGIAKLLIRMAVAEHASEAAPVILNVLRSNENALALYQSIGFKMFSFHSAHYSVGQKREELESQWKKAKVLSRGHELESREIDVTSDEFILQLLGKGLKHVNGGQSIFKLNWEKVFSGPLEWRRRYYGKQRNAEGHEISNAVSLLKMLWEYKSIGVYLDGEIVGFYCLWMPLGQMTYICILPTTDGKAAKIANYMLKDAVCHLADDNKKRKSGFLPWLEIAPAFQFSYLCVTDKEREFWKKAGAKLSGMMLLGNRNTIERKTDLTDEEQGKLPEDMQLCYAVATGRLPTQDICAKLTAQDWLYLVAGLRKRHCNHRMTFACKNWSVFSQETLVTLFTSMEIHGEDFLNHIDLSKLTPAQWARIIWVNDEIIPQCPKEIWEQFTPSIWEEVMAHNASKEWHFGTLQELINKMYDPKVKEFFQEHPEYADKYPIGSSWHYRVSTQEIMGYGSADSEGVPYPDLLLEHDFSEGQEFVFYTDDGINDKGDLE